MTCLSLAKEHWFKADEHWVLSLVNAAEKTAIEKQYYPTLFIGGETAELEAISVLMREQLHLAALVPELPDERRAHKAPAVYLIAYSPDRTRK